jgi:predicted MFS family arabinose efflux permease
VRAWLGVFSLALGAAIIVTTEFTPVGFLPNVSRDLNVSLGTAGLMVLVPGLSAAVAAPLVIVGAGRLDRRLLIVALGVLVLSSNAIAAVAPNFGVVVLARVFLGIAIGGFWAVVPSLGFRLTGPKAGTRATSIILAGLSAGTVVGLPAGQFFGNLIGWRLTFAVSAVLAALLFIGYGLAGIVGTLAGPALVERDRMLTFGGAAAAFGVVLALLPALAGAPVLVSVLIGAWGILWGLVPLALQTHMLTATPNAPEAASAIFITVMQLAIAIGSGLGGILVDSAGLSVVFVVSGITAIASAFFALLARYGV